MRRVFPLMRRAAAVLAIAAAALAFALPLAALADTIGQTYNLSTVAKKTWVTNFDRTLDGIEFDLGFYVDSAKRDADDSWDVSLKFFKAITNPTSDPEVYFNADVVVYADGVQKTTFGPGSRKQVLPGKSYRAESSAVTIKVPNGGKVHITSKGKSYGNGITSVGSSYLDFYLQAPTYRTVAFKDGYTGETISTQSVLNGAAATAPDVPGHTGYVFEGWDRGFSSVTSNMTVTANYRPASYAVAFNSNGGTGTMADMAMTYDAAKNLTANSFAKTGYTFAGWNTEDDGSGTAYKDKQEVKNLTAADGGKVTLYAQWKANRYEVAFDANDAAATGTMANQRFTYDAAQALHGCAFVLEGHSFAGWNTKADGSGAPYADREAVENLTAEDGGTVTLYARWARDTFPVAFTDGLGTTLATDTVPWGTAAQAPDAPERTGYTFAGWDKDFSKVTEPMTVHAQWRANAYAVAFDANGGSGTMDDQELEYDKPAELSKSLFERAGYAFQGWALEKDGAVSFADRQRVKNLASEDGGTVTLFAVWDENADVEIRYTSSNPTHSELTNALDAVAPATGTPAGSEASALAGYRFDGWVDVATGATVGDDPAFMPGKGEDGLWHAAVYEAQINPISYTVSFDANGGEGGMADMAMTYDAPENLAGNAFSRAGYSFAGWATEPGGEVAYSDAQEVVNLADEDGATVTLFAAWAENPDVTITYVADDPAHSSPSLASETVAPATGEAQGSVLAVAEGYSFDQWSDWAGNAVGHDPAFVPARGKAGLWRTSEYTAYVSPISYAVAFDANGGTGRMGDQQMTYDEAEALDRCAFERAGHIFIGWSTAPDGSGTSYGDAQEVVNLTSEEGGEVTLYAQWAKKTLAVTFYDGQGHIIETVTVPYGGKAEAPADPEREGHSFAGWDTAFGCVTEDLDVTALWMPVGAEEEAPAQDGEKAPNAASAGMLDQTGGGGLALAGACALASLAGSAALFMRRARPEGSDD